MKTAITASLGMGLILTLACCSASVPDQTSATIGGPSPSQTKDIIYAAAVDLGGPSYIGDLPDAIRKCYNDAKSRLEYDTCMAFDAAATSRYENGIQTGTHLPNGQYFSADRLTKRLEQFSDRGFGSLPMTVAWLSDNLSQVVHTSEADGSGHKYE